MKRVFLSAPLFSVVEREYNNRVAEALWDAGYEVFLPQKEADRIRASDPDKYGGLSATPEQRELIGRLTFDACANGIASTDLLIALLDGTDVDSGTAWEVGYAYAKGIPILGVRSDKRSMQRGPVNIMIGKSLNKALYYDNPAVSVDEVISDILQGVKELLTIADADADS